MKQNMLDMRYVHQHFVSHHNVWTIYIFIPCFRLDCWSAGDKLCPVCRYIPSLHNMQNVVSKVRDN